jgi:hypothetical protein
MAGLSIHPDDRRNIEHWWNEDLKVMTEILEEKAVSVTLYLTTNPMWTALEWHLGLCIRTFVVNTKLTLYLLIHMSL